jgi:hypothetical protein
MSSPASQKESVAPDRVENGVGLRADRIAGIICKPRRVISREVLACHVRGECSDPKFLCCMKAIYFHSPGILPWRVHSDINRKNTHFKLYKYKLLILIRYDQNCRRHWTATPGERRSSVRKAGRPRCPQFADLFEYLPDRQPRSRSFSARW